MEMGVDQKNLRHYFYLQPLVFELKSFQNEKCSKLKVFKIKIVQNEKRSKLKAFKIKSVQN